LGLLPHDLVLNITRFYENFHLAKANLPLLVKPPPAISYHVATVLEPAVSAIYDIRAALRKIEELAGIPKADDPDCGLADAIVEMHVEDRRRWDKT
jgi:hypothetical protein